LQTVQVNAQVKPLSLLKNGAMTEGTEVPVGWGLWKGAGQPRLSRDTTQFQTGPASLKLESGADAYGSASQSLGLTDEPIIISGYLKTTPNIAESNVAVQVFDEKGKQTSWISLFSGPVENWTRWEKTVTLPKGTARANLITTIKGEGALLLDEIETKLAQDIWRPREATNTPITNVAPLEAAVTVTNGSMGEGDAAPTGWAQLWTGMGKLKLVRDTTDSQTGPSSLRLESDGGPAQGSASSRLVGSGSYKLSGVLKSAGDLEEAQVAVQSFDAKGRQVGWKQLGDAKGKTDWTPFSQSGSPPAEAAYSQIVIVIKGNGKVWLDEIKSE
jgi:hypothetical protein